MTRLSSTSLDGSTGMHSSSPSGKSSKKPSVFNALFPRVYRKESDCPITKDKFEPFNPIVHNVTHIRREREADNGMTWYEVTGDDLKGEYKWAKSSMFNAPDHVLDDYLSRVEPVYKPPEDDHHQEHEVQGESEEEPKPDELDDATYQDKIKNDPFVVKDIKVAKLVCEARWRTLPVFLVQDKLDRSVVVGKDWLLDNYYNLWSEYLFRQFSLTSMIDIKGRAASNHSLSSEDSESDSDSKDSDSEDSEPDSD